MSKPLVVLVLLVVVGGATALFLGSASSASAGPGDATGGLFTVKRGDLPVTITEDGTLMAKESKDVIAQIKGQGKIVTLVEEGKAVVEGEVLCKLDPTDMQTQVERTEMEIVAAEAELNTARTELEIQDTENTAAMEQAGIALDRARQELERYRDGDAPQERRTLAVAIKDAETEHLRSQKRFEDSKKLLEQNFIKKIELEDHQVDFEKCTVKKEGAELAMRIFEKYTLPMNTKEKETKVRDAERELATADKRGKSKLRQKEVAVELSNRKLKQLRKSLVENQTEIAHMVIKAPCPGIVVYGDPRRPWDRENIKVGGTLWAGFTVMTIPDLRVMQIKLHVHEADINKVQLAQTGKVTMDTYPGLVLAGEVTKIGAIAGGRSPWDSESEVKRFAVEMTLRNSEEHKLRPGISAKAEIGIAVRKDVLFVPLQCVFLESGDQLCRVLGADSAPTKKTVKVGMSNETFIEILEGLEEGARVLLFNPNLPAESQSKTEKSPDGAKDSPAGTIPVAASASK